MSAASENAADIKSVAQAQRQELLGLCAELVSARSPQPEGDTTAPVRVLSAFLEKHGLRPEIRSATPTKPNIVCGFDTGRPGPHLILNGHMDTLNPGDPSDWLVPIYQLQQQAGRITGLGIGNMKAGVAALAMAYVGLSRNRAALCGKITLTLVADEVVFGPDGTAFLLDGDESLLGDAVINAEGPGGMNLAIAEKGLLWLSIEATAPPGQGMLSQQGSSAIARLSKLLASLDQWNDEQSAPPPDVAVLANNAGEHGLRLSVNAGTISGGSFVSQVATRAVAEVDFRVPPGMKIDKIMKRVCALAEQIGGIKVTRIKGWDPNWTAIDSELCTAMLDATAAIRGEAARSVVRLPASDAARWRARGIPAICYGPQAELASGVNDYVYEEDVVDCVAVYMAAAAQICGGEGRGATWLSL
ncbi:MULTISPECIES: M20/M25/M40 family metallo-hydrolase [Mesorhizobium]|nr:MULTISPECIES: M20/M25/M40 family metallo-hydrolase [Mesorhizobium]